jgi:hypothetical protein
LFWLKKWLGQGFVKVSCCLVVSFNKITTKYTKSRHEIHETKTETEEVTLSQIAGCLGFSKIVKSCVWVEAKNPVATARGSDPGASRTSTSNRTAYVSASHPRANQPVSDEISSHLTIRKYQLSRLTRLTSFS